MRRADRLFAILQALRGGRLRTAEALAEALEVSTRTVYRDVADLQAQGVPIDGERGIGYLLREGYFLPPLALTRLEFEALDWGVAFVAAHGDDTLAAAARELRVKLEAVVPGGFTRSTVLAFGTRLGAAQRAMLKAARDAVAARRKLHLRYLDAAGQVSARIVRPLGLDHWGMVWTRTAWCELREDFRAFRIDRLRGCEVLPARFRPEAGRRMEDYLATLRGKA